MRTDRDARNGIAWGSPFDNTCGECDHEWRSRGEPAACPECGSSMDAGESVDLFAGLRDVTDDDPLAGLRRELERRQADPSAKGLPEFTERVDPWDRDLPAGRSYRGGGQTGETRLWKRRRTQALERDNHRCQVCSIRNAHHAEFTGQSLEVHHIIPRDQFSNPDDRHALSNLITVCFQCHADVEGLSREELRNVAEREAWLKPSRA